MLAVIGEHGELILSKLVANIFPLTNYGKTDRDVFLTEDVPCRSKTIQYGKTSKNY
jgi:phenylacetate-coenzyme A ligase PaaK-like adenylate-forming protein